MRNDLILRDPFLRWAKDLTPWTEFENVFDRFFTPAAAEAGALRTFDPACDVEETDTHYYLTFDMPGLAKDDVKIEYYDKQLVVEGERREEKADNKRHLTERYHGSFRRTFTLPAGVEADKIEAAFKDGVLKIAVPKTEAAKPRKVEIKIGAH